MAEVTLKVQQRKGIKRPVIHILMPDGRVTEFKNRAIVIPENDGDADGEQAVFVILVNREGVPYVTPEGDVAILPCQPFELGLVSDPQKPLTLKEVASRANVSLSTVKRAVAAGELTKPHKIGQRSVRVLAEDVKIWMESLRKQ